MFFIFPFYGSLTRGKQSRNDVPLIETCVDSSRTNQTQMKAPLIILLLSLASVASAARLMPEKHYQKLYAEQVGGQMEVTAPDGTRCDILTDDLAIEVKFAGGDFLDAVGQSLNYGFQLNRKPAILLIMEHKEDERHFIRLGSLIRHYGLEIELIPLRQYGQ